MGSRLLQGPHFVVRPHGQMGKQINLFLSLTVKLIPAYWALPGSPVVRTSPSNVGGGGLIPDLGAEIPHATGPKT